MKFATVEIDPSAWAQMSDHIRHDFLRLHKRSMAERGYFAVYQVRAMAPPPKAIEEE